MKPRLRAILLGTGSSGGVPRIGNEWGVCDPTEPRNRRRRCSLLVEYQERPTAERPTRILIDTSPDLREQLLDIGIGELDAVVFTHDHADQTHGFDDLRVVAYRMRRRLPVFLDSPTAHTLVAKFEYAFEGEGGYPAIVDRQPLIEPGSPFSVDGPGGRLELLPLSLVHGDIRSLGFRMGGLAYCNDVSDIPADTLAALGELDIFIVDALRHSPHPSHAHLERTLGWIETLEPNRAVLTNLHIDMDYRTLLADLPPGIEPGYDGMVLETTQTEFPIM